MNINPISACLLFCLTLIFFSLSSVISFTGFSNWHDQQRAFQMALLILSSLVFFTLKINRLENKISTLLILIFLIGVTSAVLAPYLYWSSLEVVKYFLLVILVLVVRSIAKRVYFQHFVFWLVASIAFILISKSLLNYIFDLLIGVQRFDIRSIYYGFDNPRFFGQFQVVSIPIIGFLCSLSRSKDFKCSTLVNSLLLFALIAQWSFAFALGSRGVWLALGLTFAFIFLAKKEYRSIIKLQLITLLVGFLLYYLMFNLIPDYMATDARVYDSLRQTSSGRIELWYESVNLAIENLFLGIGPMHFASLHSAIVANPHQMFLQFLVEWGVFAMILMLVLTVWGVLHSANYVIRNRNADNFDVTLFASIVAVLMLAQVDSVFVMPYIEVWLAVLIGLGFSRWETGGKQTISHHSKIFLLPLLVISGVLFMFALNDRFYQDTKGFYILKNHENIANTKSPRFWLQGRIPMTAIE